MVEAAAFLCPISYLNHISAPLVLKMVSVHLDQVSRVLICIDYFAEMVPVSEMILATLSGQMIVAMGVHELNFRRSYYYSLSLWVQILLSF